MKKRFDEEQVIRILREASVLSVQIREVCRRHNITEQTFVRRRRKLSSASPAEIRLAPQALKTVAVPRAGRGRPRQRMVRLIADRAYDGEGFRNHLAARGIELVCPHRNNRRRPATQDGRKLRRYRRRWRIERTIAGPGHFRRLVVRYGRQASVFLAFRYFACAFIVLRQL